MDSPSTSLGLLRILPGEIRNQIFEICIFEALKCAKAPRLPTPTPKFRVSVLPQWCGPGSMRISGIGSLPLLFVNKQIYNEVSSLVYSRLDEVSIGPYGLQYSNEDPNVRYKVAYSLLSQRPHIMKHTKNVKVFLPWLRHDLLRNHWRSLGHKSTELVHECYACKVVPGLVEFLKTFESLLSLTVVLVAEVREPPDLSPLLALHNLCSNGLALEIVEPSSPGNAPRIAAPQVLLWATFWDSCLAEHTRARAESDAPS